MHSKRLAIVKSCILNGVFKNTYIMALYLNINIVIPPYIPKEVLEASWKRNADGSNNYHPYENHVSAH